MKGIDWYEKYNNQCHISDQLSAEIDCLKAELNRIKNRKLNYAAMINMPWDREPDRFSIRKYKSGEVIEFSYIEGQRCIDISFYSSISPEMCLNYLGSYGWTLRCDMIYDGSDAKARIMAWNWLCGGPEPER